MTLKAQTVFPEPVSGKNIYAGFGRKRGGGGETMFIAASNASHEIQRKADIVVDGTSDEVEINQALSQCKSVTLSEGTFDINESIIIGSDTTLTGVGMTATILSATSLSGDAVIRPVAGSDSNFVFFPYVGFMRIDGNSSGGSSNHGVFLDTCNHGIVDTVHIQDVGGDCVRMNGFNSSTVAVNNKVYNSRLEDAGGRGVFVRFNAPNNHIYSNIIGGAGSASVEIQNVETLISNNHIHSATTNGILMQSGAALRTQITGNIIEGSGSQGINVTASSDDNNIVGNMLFNNTGAAIYIQGDDNLVDGNRALNKSGTDQTYGLEIASASATNNIVGANNFNGNATGTVLDNGTGTTIYT